MAAKMLGAGWLRASVRPENAAHQRYTGYRLLVALVFVLAGTTAGLTGTVLYLLPLQRYFPLLVRVDDARSIAVEVTPLIVTKETRYVYIRAAVEAYVRARHRVAGDAEEMQRRWEDPYGIVRNYSAPAVYEQFLLSADDVLKDLQRAAYSRDVEVLNADEVDRNYWNVRFRTEVRLEGQGLASKTSVRMWRAYVRIAPIEYKTAPTMEELMKNRDGFLVTSYSFSAEQG